MSNSNTIPDDGYTERAYIAPTLSHGPVRFEYRPATHGERYKIQTQVRGRSGYEQSALMCVKLAPKIVAWDIVDSSGVALAINPSTLSRVKPAIVERLYEIVMGYSGSDLDPESDVGRDDSDLADEAATKALLLGEVREERDEKNS